MYFSYRIKSEIKELYWNSGLYNLAINLTLIFEPIFLYNLGYSIIQILDFFILVYLTYVLTIIPITKLTSKIGYKHSMLISSVIYVGYWFLLYQIKFHTGLFFIAPVFFGLQKSFFWPPYNADVAISNIKVQRAREVGVLFSLIEGFEILGPLIGGLISFQLGFPALFITSAILMLLSVYPLFQTPEIYTTHRFHFRNFWNIVRMYPNNFFGYWGYAEDFMIMTLWPLFMYFVLGQTVSVGLTTTFASFIAVMVMLYLGRQIDLFPKFRFLPLASVFYGFTWFFRAAATTVLGIVGFDVLTRLGKAMVRVPMFATSFEIMGEKTADYAIAYGTFLEFSLAIGKLFTALIAIWILTYTNNIPYVFIAVGFLTMLYGLIRRK